jgi:DNA invertase Pin-like site-specific DNA recombinase
VLDYFTLEKGTESMTGEIEMVMAYSYLRCSKKKQLKGDTRDRQTEWSAEVAEKRGFALDDAFRFEDWGTSAYRSKNVDVGQLGKFLDAVARGRIAPGSVLMVESLDRLSRDFFDDAFEVFRRILKAGITVITRTPEREYTREGLRDNFMSFLEPLFIFMRANEESAVKAMRSSSIWTKKRSRARDGKPHGAKCPAWCRLAESGYVLVPEHAETVRTIYRLALDGIGILRIASALRDRPTMGYGAKWTVPYVRNILCGRTAVGEYQPTKYVEAEDSRDVKRVPDGDPIPGYYPAVVDEATWRAVQVALSKRRYGASGVGRPAKDEANLLTGLVREAHTNASMMMQARAPRGRKRHVYLFVRRAGGMQVPYRTLEEAVLSTVSMLTAKDVVDRPSEVDDRDRRIQELAAQQTELTYRLDTFRAQVRDPATPRERVAFLVEAAGDVELQRQAVVRDLDALKQEARTGRPEALAESQSLVNLLRIEPTTELRRRVKAALRGVVAGVWVYGQRVSERRQVFHVQIRFHNGTMRYLQLVPDTKGVKPLDLSGVDFRCPAS